MTGITPHGISYPDGASKAKNLGPELQKMAEDIDTFIDASFQPGAPIFIDAATAAAQVAVAAVLTESGIPRSIVGKNLFNPNVRQIGQTLGNTGALAPLAGYNASDYIPVRAGQSFTTTARNMAFYNSAKVFVAGSFVNNAAGTPVTATATVDGYLRVSVFDLYLPTFQVELGTVATAWEQYQRTIEPAIEVDDPTIARTITGKNLFDSSARNIGYALGNVGQLAPLAGYSTSDFIAVVTGQTYTISNPRSVAFYDRNRVNVAGTFIDNPTRVTTTVTPTMDGYLRASMTDAHLPTFQVEKGAAATPWEAYRLILDPSILAGAAALDPLEISQTGSTWTVSSALGATNVDQAFTLAAGGNGVFNFLRTIAPSGEFHTVPDSIAPIRTQQGTIGANHGFSFIGRWAAHDKTAADLGSVWTDGAREYVILKIDGTGVWVGGDYTTAGNGARASANVSPAADLTHVSGATNTSPLAQAGSTLQQMYPAIARRTIRATVDGAPISAGRGKEVVIREAYDILDYASIYDLAQANIGTPYSALPVEAAVRVESEWIIRDGLKMVASIALTEVSPTDLAATGFVQAEAMNVPAQQTRWIPGVKPIAGNDWSAGVAHTAIVTSEIVKAADLHRPSAPPTLMVDWRADIAVGFAMGYEPWQPIATSNAQRVANTPTNYWDVRSTRKVYPNAIGAKPAGWARAEARARRAYLTLAERDSIIATPTDSLAATAALTVLTGK